MPKYTIRIELNGPPNPEIYEKLHDQMSNAGYERWILSDKGGYWKLPDGMYVGNSARNSASDERMAIKVLTDAVWRDSEMIVFQYSQSSWVGLTRLTADT